MPKFTKRPVEIEARQLPPLLPEDGHMEAFFLTEWMVSNGYPWLVGNALEPETLEPKDTPGIWIRPEDGGLMIRTLEGDHHVSPGDWVIQGVKGEFYPCKPDIFEVTYDRVS